MCSAIIHEPVMVRECIRALSIKPAGVYVDVTGGCGGHSVAILENLSSTGRLLIIDTDEQALEILKSRFASDNRVTIIKGRFSGLAGWAELAQIEKCDGIIADLGTSALQLGTSKRGFSFMRDGPLDMRMSSVPGDAQSRPPGFTAYSIVNEWPEKEISRIIHDYGEDRRYRRIARAITASRPVKTTLQLAGIIEKACGGRREKIHPATRTFQAIRIVVNNELEELKQMLDAAAALLNPAGRLVILSYHSIEDRVVKMFMRHHSAECICPPGLPECMCNHKKTFDLPVKKPIKAQEAEIAANPGARSARLRVMERRAV